LLDLEFIAVKVSYSFKINGKLQSDLHGLAQTYFMLHWTGPLKPVPEYMTQRKGKIMSLLTLVPLPIAAYQVCLLAPEKYSKIHQIFN
jgi:hypothetical protein